MEDGDLPELLRGLHHPHGQHIDSARAEGNFPYTNAFPDAFPDELPDSLSDLDDDRSDAQQHWEESLRQLEQAVFWVLCPVVGRLIGRRVAHSLWKRYVDYKWLSWVAKHPVLLESKSSST